MTKFSTVDNNRIHARCELAKFHASFFKDAGCTQPVVPLDSAEYPAFTIYDSDNICVFKGVGTPFGGAGSYQVRYDIPQDATLSCDEKRWRIDWLMVSDDNRQLTYKQEFDVIDTAVTAADNRELKYITIAGKQFRAILRLTFQPDFLQLDVTRGGFDTLICTAVFDSAQPKTGPIKMVTDGDSKVFYYDIDGAAIDLVGVEYNLLWTIRPTVTDINQFAVNHLYTVNAYIMSTITSLRMLIDKFQKRIGEGLVQAYEDSDLVEYIQRGSELLNSSYPSTAYSIFTIPAPLRVFHIMASAMYGLNAQQLLEIDLGFSFCLDENTLVPTENGLVRASELYETANDTYKIAAEANLVGLNRLEEIYNLEISDPIYLQDLSNLMDLNPSTMSLASSIGKLNLSDRKYSDKKGRYLWDFSNLEPDLDKFGIFNKNILKKDVGLDSILTPFGFEKPLYVHKFEKKDCLRIENELGYPLVTTKNHPFLILDTESFEIKWKLAEDLKIGDLVAINREGYLFGTEYSLEHKKGAVENSPSICHDKSILPNKWSPELGRILGYLISEGDVTSAYSTTFFNTNEKLVEDYSNCVATCFKGLNISIDTKENPGSFSDKDITTVDFSSVKVRRFLSSLGLEYSIANYKKIPSSVFTAPKEVIVGFIRGFVEGDGCVYVGEKVDKDGYKYKQQSVILTSSSERLMIDFQNLLLQFGILSTLTNPKTMWKVTISGKDIIKYAEEIGFLFKGKDMVDVNVNHNSKKEAMPQILVAIKKNLRGLLNLDSYGRLPGNSKRWSISWNKDHSSSITRYVTWWNIDKWFNDRQETLAEISPEIYNRIKLLVDTKYLWKPVKSIEDAGPRTVIDPSFETRDHPLAHTFVSGGIITHNTGQSVTLDYDHASQIEGVINRWQTYIGENLPAAKMGIVRATSPVGTYAGRSYRYNSLNSFTYKIASHSGAGGGGTGIIGQLNHLGLLF